MKRKSILFMVLLLFGMQATYSQHKVRGTVTSAEDGSGIPGVSVLVKGTTQGTITDLEGRYNIDVPDARGILFFSFVGMQSKEVPIDNRSVIDVALQAEDVGIDEVVVTAIGIKRDKKALSYAVEEMDGEDIARSNETNMLNALTGKFAGVQVTQSSGAVGSSSRILLRGYSSIDGNNQPLFVVDGVPIDNSNYSNNPDKRTISRQDIDYGNAAQDINPDDIESISVLKGASAAALYGSRAANGAIIITTKTGTGMAQAGKKLGVTYNASVGLATPLILPDYQDTYGQGYNRTYLFGPDVEEEFLGLSFWEEYGVYPDESWGPKMGEGKTEMHPITGEMVPYVPQPDNRKEFYDLGVTYNNSLAIGGGNEKLNYRFSWTNLNQKGIMPTSEFKRNTFNLNAGYQVSKRLHASTNISYIKAKGHNREYQGQSDGGINIMFLWNARNFNYREWRDMRDENGVPMSWNPAFWDNPWFILENNPNDDVKDRVIGNTTLTLDIVEGLKLIGRVGLDTYNHTRMEKYAFNGIGTGYDRGGFINQDIQVSELNTDLYLSYNKQLNENFDLNAILGQNIRQRNFNETRIAVNNLVVPDVFNLSNAADQTNRNYESIQRLHGVYFSASLGFRRFLYLDVTGRNDWSSTLPVDNRSYFYPSVGLGFIFTEALKLDDNIFSYGKLRASWAQVGRDTKPYQLRQSYVKGYVFDSLSDDAEFPFGSTGGFTMRDTKANPDLKPEIKLSVEMGADLRFFKNRIGIDFTYYDETTKNQIIEQSLPPSTGFRYQMINAGEIRNRGVELLLSFTPVKLKDFRWDMNVNFAKNKNELISLTEGIEAITLEGGFTSLSIQARVGEPYGAIYGLAFERDSEGNPVVSADDGLPIIGNDPEILGNTQPDWMGGLRNTFTYKNIQFSFLIDTKQGGDIFSNSVALLRYTGQVAETETLFGYTREEEFVIPNSVVENEDGSFSPNTTPTTIADYYHHGLFVESGAGTFDASYIKLREMSLSYTLPMKWAQKVRLEGVRVGVTGRNLALWGTNIPHIDPEVNMGATTNNNHGVEYANSPTTRNITFNLKLSF